jgi:hypothetical protein
MEELVDLRVKLMEKYELFSKLGGEWNAGYFQGIAEALSILEDAIRTLERQKLKSKQSVDHYHKSIKNNKNDAWKINWDLKKKF